MKKRLISLMLVMVMVLSMIPAASATQSRSGNFLFTYGLTGTAATDMVNIALAQKGRTGAQFGYTEQWCCDFVCDVAKLAGQSAAVPAYGAVKGLYDRIIKKGGKDVTAANAKPGDMVCIDWNPSDGTTSYAHIEMVYKVSNGKIYTVGGNTGTNNGTLKTRFVDTHDPLQTKYIVKIVRPAYKNDTSFAFTYNAGGGTGSKSGFNVTYGNKFTPGSNTFTRSGFTFQGWNVQRSDGKWHVKGQGWLTDAQIKANGYTKSLYAPSWNGTFDTSWTKTTNKTPSNLSYTFYAVWQGQSHTVRCYDNYSQKNYFSGAGAGGWINTSNFKSRDTAVHNIYVDTSTRRVPEYATMKITVASAGASGKDMAWASNTQGNYHDNAFMGDNKAMTLSFWAKGTVEGAKLYVRWGYQPTTAYKSVTLTKNWKFYTIRMDKTIGFGNNMHPYIDTAGTYWISELQLEDGTSATSYTYEEGSVTAVNAENGTVFSNLSLPQPNEKEGKTFLGWYTAASGGTRVSDSSAVLTGHTCLYAHWSDHVCSYVSRIVVIPTTQTGLREVSCTGCGDTFTEVLPPIISPCNGGSNCPTQGFADVKSTDWHHLYVDFVVDQGLMKGTSATRFEPESPMTRAMLVTVLWRLEGSPSGYANIFTDVPANEWYAQSVAWAASNGIVTGTGNGKFSPNDNITREQLAVILQRYCAGKGYATELSQDLSSFPDQSQISDWARSGVRWAVRQGLLAGSDGKLLPGGNATRAQVATILTRFLGYVLE